MLYIDQDYSTTDRKEIEVAGFILKGRILGREYKKKTKQSCYLSQIYFYEKNFKLY